MVSKTLFSSETAEWETPQWLFDQLDEEFCFTLDVCATSENAKCARYFSPEINALSQSWAGETCWMNPPYGRGIELWVGKAYTESQAGAKVVCLLPARTDTKYYHSYIWDLEKNRPRDGVEIRFLKGRLKFGRAKNGAPFPSMVVVFGKNVKKGKIK